MEENVVGVYNDILRQGFRRGMFTDIEDPTGRFQRLAHLQARIQRKQASANEERIETYYYEASDIYKGFPEDGLDRVLDLCSRAPFPKYKNADAFLLGYILSLEGFTPEGLGIAMQVAKETGRELIHETDIIRYARLILLKLSGY